MSPAAVLHTGFRGLGIRAKGLGSRGLGLHTAQLCSRTQAW